MIEKAQIFWAKNKGQLLDTRNIGLYIFTVIVLAITWSTIKTIQSNYDLQKQASLIKQENQILQLQNQSTALGNKYLQTDQYLDLAARQNLGLAAPGEKVLLVPKTVSAKYLDASIKLQSSNLTGSSIDSRPKYIKNIEAWRDFLLGRSSSSS